MGWYDPKDVPGAKNPDAETAAEAVDLATADAKFRTDLIAVLREIRDALTAASPGTTPPEQHQQSSEPTPG